MKFQVKSRALINVKMHGKSETNLNIQKPNNGSLGDGESANAVTKEIYRNNTYLSEISTDEHAYLEIKGTNEETIHIKLGEGEIILGRSPACDIQLKNKNVSREHALLVFRNEEYYIEDLNSTNGIHINGVKIAKCILRDQDQIDMGGVKILFYERIAF